MDFAIEEMPSSAQELHRGSKPEHFNWMSTVGKRWCALGGFAKSGEDQLKGSRVFVEISQRKHLDWPELTDESALLQGDLQAQGLASSSAPQATRNPSPEAGGALQIDAARLDPIPGVQSIQEALNQWPLCQEVYRKYKSSPHWRKFKNTYSKRKVRMLSLFEFVKDKALIIILQHLAPP